jgi:hypothetical protein
MFHLIKTLWVQKGTRKYDAIFTKIIQNRGQKEFASNGNKNKHFMCFYVVFLKRASVMSRTLNLEMSR